MAAAAEQGGPRPAARPLAAHRVQPTQETLTVARDAAPPRSALEARRAARPAGDAPTKVLRWRTPVPGEAPILVGDDQPVSAVLPVAGEGEPGELRRAARIPAALVPDPFDGPDVSGRGVVVPDDVDGPELTSGAPSLFELAQERPVPSIPPANEAADVPGQDALLPPPDVAPGQPLDVRDRAERTPCEEEQQKCDEARQRLKDNRITMISLDITPTVAPQATSADELAVELQKRLDAMLEGNPADRRRTWRNRVGEEVAVGQLTNVRQGRAEVVTPDGETIRLPVRDLSDADQCFLASVWNVPNECRFAPEEFAGRSWEPLTMTWKASALCHKPLYFEEVALERYGHTPGPLLEPFWSGAHFFANLAIVPYRAGINPPWECRYSLGYYRPGSCAPWLVPPIPWSVRGALWEAGFWVGGIALIP